MSQEPKTKKKTKKDKPVVDYQQLQDIANQMRVDSITMTNQANSGHPTSCASIAELLSSLFFDPNGMHYDPADPANFANDRFVLSKGHAAPILYSAWSLAGAIHKSQLITLREIDSLLSGHPLPSLSFVDVATGSLGQGLSVAGGMAYSSKYIDKINNRYWVLMGDGECAEGSVWEALNLIKYYKLDNVTAIVDVNRLGQSTATQLQHQVDTLKKRFESFGWITYKIDGHDFKQIIETYKKCRNAKNSPQVILAKTFKGKGLGEDIENQLNWHGKPLGEEKGETVIKQLKESIKTQEFTLKGEKPELIDRPKYEEPKLGNDLEYKVGEKVSTRKAYGNALVRLIKNGATHIFALDGDLSGSTCSSQVKTNFKDNFIECFIAEQNMVGWAQGLTCRGKLAYCSTFGAFFTRAFDQIRMGGISENTTKYVGSHSGVSIGQDGPSQMGLEDISMFKCIPNSVILYPSDGVSTEKAVELAARTNKIVYVKTGRPDQVIYYENDEIFEIGKCKVVKQGQDIVLVCGGITLSEGFKANELLQQQNITCTIIDIFSVKPLDVETLIREIEQTKSKSVLCVEDHYLEGGIYESVCMGLSQNKDIKAYGLYVNSIPHSGSGAELLKKYSLDGEGIANKVQEILK